MAQLSDDCFAFDGPLMPFDEALEELRKRLQPIIRPENIPTQFGLDRFLASNVISTETVPPADNSAVDGFAIHFDDLYSDQPTTLPVIGRAAAGHPFTKEFTRGSAVQIFTGAIMPSNTDTVMMSEDCQTVENKAGDVLTVTIAPGIKRGANSRRAGEDISSGQIVLRKGHRLRPQDIGMLAAAGYKTVAVNKPLKVALLSTGDELREPGVSASPGTICDSNRHGLRSFLEASGCVVTDLGIQKDDLGEISGALHKAAANHDLILSSGGMSIGKEDHVKSAVEDLGSLFFWRLAIKPGRPIAFGQVKDCIFVGLPGNPAAAIVTFLTLVRPLLYHLKGGQLNAFRFNVSADFHHKKKPGRREWLRASLHQSENGGFNARKFSREGAGILSSLVEADGLVEIAEDVLAIAPGDQLQFLPFSEALK